MNDLNTTPSEMLEPEVEVDLALPMKRIGAALLNSVLGLMAYIPMIVSILNGEGGYLDRVRGLEEGALPEFDTTWLMIGLAVLAVYCVIQLYFMSRDGQSLGKKVLGIRVLKTDGTNPGFFGTVFMREGVYYFLLGLVAGIAAYAVQAVTGNVQMFEWVSNLLQLAAYLVCLVMLFQVKNDRRTLQDYLAKTVVVQLPKR